MKLAKLLIAAALFAASGAISARFLTVHFDLSTCLLVPASFSLLCLPLVLKKKLGVVALLAYPAVWILAYLIATFLAMLPLHIFREEEPLLVAGALGGLGVTMVTARFSRTFPPSLWVLTAACILGCIAAEPFASWLPIYRAQLDFDPTPDLPDPAPILKLGFATWQGGIGTFLYLIDMIGKKPLACLQPGSKAGE